MSDNSAHISLNDAETRRQENYADQAASAGVATGYGAGRISTSVYEADQKDARAKREREETHDFVQHAIQQQIQELDFKINDLLDEKERIIADLKSLKSEVTLIDHKINSFQRFLDGEEPSEIAREDSSFKQWFEQQVANGNDPKKTAEVELQTLLFDREDATAQISSNINRIKKINDDYNTYKEQQGAALESVGVSDEELKDYQSAHDESNAALEKDMNSFLNDMDMDMDLDQGRLENPSPTIEDLDRYHDSNATELGTEQSQIGAENISCEYNKCATGGAELENSKPARDSNLENGTNHLTVGQMKLEELGF